MTSDTCNSTNESRKTYQVKFLAGVNVCHSVEFSLMAPVYSRDARAGMSSLGREEKAQGNLTQVYKILMGEVKTMEANSSLWCTLKEQEATGTK